MRKYITKADISLIVILTALSLVSFGGMRHMDFSNGHAVVEVDGKRVLELPLDRNVQTEVTGPLGVTEIAIEDRTVRVASSPCPHGYCMHMGRISHAGEILVCVPNRVFISIRSGGKDKRAFDGVSE